MKQLTSDLKLFNIRNFLELLFRLPSWKQCSVSKLKLHLLHHNHFLTSGQFKEEINYWRAILYFIKKEKKTLGSCYNTRLGKHWMCTLNSTLFTLLGVWLYIVPCNFNRFLKNICSRFEAALLFVFNIQKMHLPIKTEWNAVKGSLSM